MRFGPGLWGSGVVVGQIRRTRKDSAVGEGLGQPLGSGRERKELAEGESVGVVRESRGLKYLYLYALLFASSPRPRSVPSYYSYLEIPSANDVLHLN